MTPKDDENDDSEIATNRISLRLNPGLYQKMLEMGAELGFDTATAAAKHFLTLGIQFSLSQFANTRSARTSEQLVQDFYHKLPDQLTALFATEREAEGAAPSHRASDSEKQKRRKQK